MFIGLINLPSIVTFLGLTLGVLSMYFAFQKVLPLAMICFIYAGLCDLFDGVIARKVTMSDNEKQFGVQIDSIVDMACFGVLPILLAMNFGFSNSPFNIIIYVFFAVAAAMRLAYFNVFGLKESKGNAYYSGLPVTFSALLIPLIYLMDSYLNTQQMEWLLRISYLTIALLFILNIPIPKPKGVFYIIFPSLAVFLTFVYLSLPL